MGHGHGGHGSTVWWVTWVVGHDPFKSLQGLAPDDVDDKDMKPELGELGNDHHKTCDLSY